MYQFLITPQYGEPVTATIAEEWDQPNELILSNGDSLSRKLIRLHIDSHGLTPYGKAIGSEFMAPMDLHHTFATSDKFTLEAVKGEWLKYPADDTAPTLGQETEELSPILDSASFHTPSTVASIAAIQAAMTIDELEAAFRTAITAADSPVLDPTITNPDFGLKASGDKYRSRINQQTKEILERVNGDPVKLTEEDREILVQYSGRGGLKEENSLYEYYTPTPVAEGVWDAMKINGFENGNTLEPSAGAGVFSATKSKGVLLTASEIDSTASQVNQLLHPEDQINNGSFESLCANTPDDSFDSVVGNIPFGPTRATNGDDEDFKHLKSFEEYFVLRSIDKCKPGGLIALICPTRVVDGSRCKKLRAMASRKAEFLGAHRMPGKTFHAQGTPVPTDAVFFRKHSRDVLDKIPDLPTKVLKESNVLWNEFITGKYFKGEGKRFVHGEMVAGFRGDDVVDQLMSKAATRAEGLQSLKKKLTVKFDSRIDWGLLESEEPIVRNYSEGDRKVINEREMEFNNGQWTPVIKTKKNSLNLDPAEYGVASVDELKALTASNHTLMKLNSAQALAAFRAFPDLFSEQQKIAIKAAEAQGLDEYREQVFRGSLLGGLMMRMEHRLKQEDEVPPEELDMLQASIRAEYEKFGDPKGNKGLILAGDNSRYFGLFSGAIDKENNFSDLMAGELDVSKSTFDATNIKSITEELFLRQGNTQISLEDIQALYKGKREIKSLGDIADEAGIAISPDGFVMPFDRYCSGEVASKLRALTTILATEKDPRLKGKFQKQIDEVNRKRKRTKIDDIGFGLNQKWYDRKYLLEFLKEQGGYDLEYKVRKTVASEDPDTGEVRTESIYDTEDTSNPFGEFDTKGYGTPSGFNLQFLHYLNGDPTRTKKEDLKDFHRRLEALQDQFNFFMQSHPDADKVTETYNLKFNGDIPYYYSGDDLKLEGVSKQVKPHWYQNQTIRRLSEEGRGIMGLDVGLGKTFSALGLAAYNKQMGRAKKTCIVVPNSVVANWYHEAKTFNGNMNNAIFVGFEPKRNKDGEILQETVKDEKGEPKVNKYTQKVMYQDVLKKDTKEQVFEKLWAIPQSNKSLIIMSEEVFKEIPLKPATKLKYQEQWSNRHLITDSDFEKAKKSYNDAKKEESVRSQFGDEGTKKRGEYPYYEDCGFDSVMVDEAHRFKNSYKTGKDATKMAYLPVISKTSKRATDMVIKMSALRDANNGRGPIMLSATPITNSPVEIFNMLSLVMPMEEFEQYGVYTPDDFVRVFGKTGIVQKLKITGKSEEAEGLTGFQNLDGLRNLFHKYAVMRNATDVDPDNKIIKLPGSEDIMAECTLNEEQEAEYEVLRAEAEEASKSRDPVGAGMRPVFSIMRDMERVTTDMDMFNKVVTWVLPARYRSNMEAVIADMPTTRTYEVYDPMVQAKEKETAALEPVFQDEGDSFSVVIHEAFEDDVTERLLKFGIQESEVAHPITPKYALLMSNLLTEHESDGKQLIFTEEKSQHRKLARIIVKHLPIDLNQIGIINADEAAGAKLQKIADAYNRGDLKIVICNKKAEVGVNLQKGTTAIHHLTFPWTPASMQQRNGRGVRQGNTASSVRLYKYAAGRTMDEYRLTSMEKKAGWIDNLINGNAATAENGDVVDDDIGMFLAADPEAYARQKAENEAKKKVAEEEKDRQKIYKDLNQLRNAVIELETLEDNKTDDFEKLQERKTKTEKTIANAEEKLKEEPDNEKTKGTIARNKATLSRTLIALEEHEGKWEAHKQLWENKHKQLHGLMKHRGEKGELPFDVSVLENPENTAVIGGGKFLIAEGMTFEQDRKGSEKAIFRVTAVDNEVGTANIEWIQGYSYTTMISNGYTLNINQASKHAHTLNQVSLSPDEITVIQLLDKNWTYAQLNQLPDKNFFYEHIDRIQLHSASDALYRIKATGALLVSDFRDVKDSDKGLDLIWPDANDENLKKELAEQTLLEMRTNGGRSSHDHNLMSLYFGSNWRSAVAEYGKKATETEVNAVLAEAWANSIKEETIHLVADPQSQLRNFGYQEERITELFDEAVKDMGDNTNDIDGWIDAYMYQVLKPELEEKVREFEAEQRRIELEEAKKNPDYKEAPEEIIQAFARLGITIRYNNQKRLSGKTNRKMAASVDPYEKLLLWDENGLNGKLKAASPTLKSRYGSRWISGIGGDWGTDKLWWHVPASTDLQDLYGIIA